MIIESGIHVVITHRRLFEGDRARYFVGRVEDYENGIARVFGYTWIQDPFDGKFSRKEEPRTKVVALGSGTIILYVLSETPELKSTVFEYDNQGRVWLTAEGRRLMDFSETWHPSGNRPAPKRPPSR